MIWAFRALGLFAHLVSRAGLGLLHLFGFLFRHPVILILALIGSGVLFGYGVYNGLLWRTPPAPQAGPGQYHPPVPGPVAAPAPSPAPAPSLPPAGPSVVPAPKAPTIVVVPQHPRPSPAPVILAEPIPELAGIEPPPPGPPPLPEAPFAVVRGYRPPLTDR